MSFDGHYLKNKLYEPILTNLIKYSGIVLCFAIAIGFVIFIYYVFKIWFSGKDSGSG